MGGLFSLTQVSKRSTQIMVRAKFVVQNRMIGTKSFPDVKPSATPTEAEIAAWQSLPRDEQLRRLSHDLDHPDCSIVSTATMADSRARGHVLAMKRRNA